MSNQTLPDAIIEARTLLAYAFPAIASHLFRHQSLEYDPAVRTAGTDGKKIVFGDWMTALPTPERVFVLAHECLHDVFQHPQRGKLYAQRGFGPDGRIYDKNRMNAAADYFINNLLVSMHVGKMPPEGLYDTQYTSAMSADEIYCMLPPDETPPSPMDEHMEPGEDEGEGEGEGGAESPQSIEECDATTRELVTGMKAAGSLGGHLARVVGQITEPVIAWQDELADFVTSSTGKDSLSWAKANMRKLILPPHAIYPGRDGFATNCMVVAPDASGSIGPQELTAFLSEIAGIVEQVRPRELYVIWWDTAAVCELIEDAEDLESLTPYGGGGTDYTCVPEIIKEKNLDPDVVVCLTDGYVRWPSVAAVPWPHVTVTTSGYTCPFGHNITMTV